MPGQKHELLEGLERVPCHPKPRPLQGKVCKEDTSLGHSVGEARAWRLAGWFSHHYSRPMSLGSHRSSTVAKAAAGKPWLNLLFLPTPFLSRGTPLSHSLLRKLARPPAWEKGHGRERERELHRLSGVGLGGSTLHPQPGAKAWFGV